MNAKGPERSAFEMTMDIDAAVADVWKALVDAVELARWFPLQAAVTPGLGGSIMLSWGPDIEGTAPITIWEPQKRLQWTEQVRPGGDTSRQPVPVTVDYYLEAGERVTRLRLVHSGFDTSSDWDGYYDSITRGWKFELRGLRHYLRHHRGKDRAVVWVRRPTKRDPQEVLSTLLGPAGRALRGVLPSAQREGDRYRLELNGLEGEFFEGQVMVDGRPRSWCATVENWNNAYFRFELEGTLTGSEAWLWLSAYAVAPERLARLHEHWSRQLPALLG